MASAINFFNSTPQAGATTRNSTPPAVTGGTTASSATTVAGPVGGAIGADGMKALNKEAKGNFFSKLAEAVSPEARVARADKVHAKMNDLINN